MSWCCIPSVAIKAVPFQKPYYHLFSFSGGSDVEHVATLQSSSGGGSGAPSAPTATTATAAGGNAKKLSEVERLAEIERQK